MFQGKQKGYHFNNIHYKYVPEAIEYWLDNFPESLHPRFSKEYVLESVKFILENNNLKFGNDYFNQIKGHNGYHLSNLSKCSNGVSQLLFYKICRNKWGEDWGNFIFEKWSSFLDDYETLLEESKINPNGFLNILNSMKPSIQFTMEYSKDAIRFLDILITQNNDKYWTNFYYKSTDTHRCLPFSSNHLSHCKKYISFTLTSRMCTIVECAEAKIKHLENLKMNLSKFQYPKQVIEYAIKKGLSIPLQELRTSKTISNDKSLPFITKYDPNNSSL